ncbi:MAG: hypothetical protein P8R54_11890 [Myxococcota bacterium]|nr:hypothetical protein [Myxococcota bacterium]
MQSDIDGTIEHILAGSFETAQSSARATADQARADEQADLATQAGQAWQIAQAFLSAQDAMADKNPEAAKGHASHAATQARALLSAGAAGAEDLQRIIDSAGKTWALAQKAASERKGGRDAPLIDQHELNHWNNGAFCGIATMVMMLQANNLNQGTSRAELNAMADRVYHPGKGTSGAQMAGVLRERGLKDSTYTTSGTQQKLIQALERGQTVPFGVVRCEGTITRLEGGSSARYTGARVGGRHEHQFGDSGHWVLVTRYEGTPEAPTAYLVNDPDLGGELRCTPAQLDAMGDGSGSYWMVHQ